MVLTAPAPACASCLCWKIKSQDYQLRSRLMHRNGCFCPWRECLKRIRLRIKPQKIPKCQGNSKDRRSKKYQCKENIDHPAMPASRSSAETRDPGWGRKGCLKGEERREWLSGVAWEKALSSRTKMLPTKFVGDKPAKAEASLPIPKRVYVSQNKRCEWWFYTHLLASTSVCGYQNIVLLLFLLGNGLSVSLTVGVVWTVRGQCSACLNELFPASPAETEPSKDLNAAVWLVI